MMMLLVERLMPSWDAARGIPARHILRPRSLTQFFRNFRVFF